MAGRWELRDGRPVLMAPERAAHELTKYAAQKALEAFPPLRPPKEGVDIQIDFRCVRRSSAPVYPAASSRTA
jgi:hypothetical protein